MSGDGRPATLRQRLFARFMAGTDEQSHAMYRTRKERLFGGLSGTVVELGSGTGVNLPFLASGVRLIAIEPNPAMHEPLRERARTTGHTVEIVDAPLDRAGLADASVDAVISTLVLCSVPSVDALLHEIRRVLRPGGRFVFLEHVVDRKWTFRRAVQRVAPYTPWRYFSDGCDPGRDIAAAIERAGFATVEIERYHQAGPGLVLAVNRPHIAGVAIA